ncbi:MAG: hypothetical protein BJ554DRAFT_8235, partial [Olpidium bornovanus]
TSRVAVCFVLGAGSSAGYQQNPVNFNHQATCLSRAANRNFAAKYEADPLPPPAAAGAPPPASPLVTFCRAFPAFPSPRPLLPFPPGKGSARTQLPPSAKGLQELRAPTGERTEAVQQFRRACPDLPTLTTTSAPAAVSLA